jgi:hypothetical protein
MKKYIIVACAFNLIACDSVLEKGPQTSISPQTFWKTEADFKMAANALYNGLGNNHGEFVDLQSDDYYGRSANSVSAGTLEPSNTDKVWEDAYTAIRRANDIIENTEASDVDEMVKNRYIAEAKFFRAYQYAELVKRFGDVPLVLKKLDLSSSELYEAKTSRDVIVQHVVEDLQWAADHLPAKQDLSKVDEGRITRGAALAVLGRVSLYEGTLRKYHEKGDAQSLLQLAKSVSKSVIEENEYALYSDFYAQFKQENEGNSETILRVFYGETLAGRPSPRSRGLLMDINMAPTKALAESFLCKDGLPIVYSPLFKGYEAINSEFVDRDPRMAHTIWEPLTPHENAELIPLLTHTRTGYYPKKPGDITALTVTYIYTDYIVMRYAEVLLNYAEACYELDGSISDADLDLSINKLRTRVGMLKLTNIFITEQKGKGYSMSMLEEIRRERRVELAGEGYRYDDIIRWKLAENVLPNTILGTKFHQKIYPATVVGTDVFLNGEGFIVTENDEKRSFKDPKNYLFPLPLRELSLNNKLTPNTGWE